LHLAEQHFPHLTFARTGAHMPGRLDEIESQPALVVGQLTN
jgi:hypothetical protein